MTLADYFPIWEKLSPSQKEQLTSFARPTAVKKGTFLQDGSKECLGLLLIQSGQLRAYISSDEGREITIYRLFERDLCLFSASCMMRSIQFDITIEAEKDTEFYLIPSEVYKMVMEESAPLSNFTNEIMATRFSEVMWLMEQVIWKSFDRRLASFLLEESAIEGTNVLKITHETIGKHMGNPREAVTRMLKYFQSEGMVKLSRGMITVTDIDKLERIINR